MSLRLYYYTITVLNFVNTCMVKALAKNSGYIMDSVDMRLWGLTRAVRERKKKKTKTKRIVKMSNAPVVVR